MSDDFQNPYKNPSVHPPAGQEMLADGVNRSARTVMFWQKFYVILMMLFCLAMAILGLLLVQFRVEIADGNRDDEIEMLIAGVTYGIMGGILFLVYSVGLFWQRGMGGWIYQIVLLGLGLTFCCSWPMTIPLLIFWIKDKDGIVSLGGGGDESPR